MAEYILQEYFPNFGDVFQSEAGVEIGFTRKTLEVEGEVGQKLYIGDFIVMESKTATKGKIPETLDEIKDAKWLGIYAGNDAYLNMNTNDPTFNHNVTTFGATTKTQDIVVVYRGRIGVAEGGQPNTTKSFSGLKFPQGTTKADKRVIWDKLEMQDIHVIKQVP